jgi:hypothetical protein
MPRAELDAPELVAHSTLANILFFELGARRFEPPVEPEPDAEDGADDSEIQAVQFLQTARRDDGTGFRVRMKIVVTVQQGEVLADVAAEYELREYQADDIADDVLLEFCNEVAIMHILPYTRHTIADLSQQVFGAPLLMPMLKRGDIRFDAASAAPSPEMPTGRSVE